MAVFSTNQVRHLYVAKTLKNAVTASDTAGSIAVLSDAAKTNMYFAYKSADNLVRSDLIDVKNILSAKATSASAMALKLKAYTVTLDSSVNGGKPVAGQDYILRVAFRQYLGMSDEDQYFKYGMVHAYADMTESEFYKVLALSLVKNFSRETTPLVKFSLTDSEGASVSVDETTTSASLKGTYKSVTITEVEQPWRLGVIEQVPVYFTVQPTIITVNGDERIWGTVSDAASAGTINNGKKIADLEYFCMGERGDQYRAISFPHNIETTYLVDPTQAYHVLDIHYAFVEGNENPQKSEKTITIVCASKDDMNTLIAAVVKITGLTIAGVS